MSKFRKKPVVIEAYCATTDSFFPAWLSDAIDGGSVHVEPSGPIYITTLEGTMRADFGDYIIRGVKGELYPCREDIFKATYEAVDDGAPQDMGNMSDGYHTFNELYEHRHSLFLVLMGAAESYGSRAWIEVDETMPGWFLAGIDTPLGQVSYHLPIRLLSVAQKQVSPGYTRFPYDGYTATDVLLRLQALAGYSPENDNERRIAMLEAAQRPHWLTPPNVNEWIAQNNPPFAAAAHPPEGDWAHIPSAEWEAICEELETLRAWKTGIWDRANAVSCPACDSKGGRMEPCVDNPDIWTECRWCNGHGVLYARPKEAGE